METKQLKDYYRRQFVEDLSAVVAGAYSDFKTDEFVSSVLNDEWINFELKERMFHITRNMCDFLPDDYERSLDILWDVPEKLTDHELSGFLLMCFPDFVEKYGLDDWGLSIKALEHFTKTSSSEFAVRPFIMKYEVRMMEQMLDWSLSDNYHVRRLASEGCRPRLPWACGLPEFKKDPSLILPILENLKDDDEEYVRKSVANNLNDISKDNPDIVIDIARKWQGESKKTDWIIKHACRTMLKQGRSDVMEIFGFDRVDVKYARISTSPDKIKIGDRAQIEIEIDFGAKSVNKLRLEYIIHFVRKDGKFSKKVYQISEKSDVSGKYKISKKHSFAQMSTRTHYVGNHKVELVINGVVSTACAFSLT